MPKLAFWGGKLEGRMVEGRQNTWNQDSFPFSFKSVLKKPTYQILSKSVKICQSQHFGVVGVVNRGW